ncbi:MAG: biotin--[acetyl-CoA-carboxylase] ligase, partial [Candidatus Binatia bacterium]
LLLKEKGYRSGETLAERLGITRAAVWKRIRSLREAEFDIEAQSRKGYCLRSCPDRLWPARIRNALSTEVIGREIVYLPVIDSTNLLAKKLAAEGRPEGTLVLAEDQTQGRGRMGRSWVSPAGENLLFSLILRPALQPVEVFRLTILSSWATAKAIASLLPLTPQIKWPNDILINDRKAGGILIEFAAEQDRVAFVVVGIGLNVNFDPCTHPELAEIATSLAKEEGRKVDRLALLVALLQGLDQGYRLLKEQRFLSIWEEWQSLLMILGRRVRIISGEEIEEGSVEGVDENGALILTDLQGRRKRIYTGDISLRL